jgi:N-acetylglutamate synthase-like GNAT family acetyltransferase
MNLIPFEQKYAKDFLDINVEWLSEMFVVEDYDFQVLSNPKKHILKNGEIWLAQNDQGEIIGTCALMEHEEKCFELTKMGVSNKSRGEGAGRALLKKTLKRAEELGSRSLFLLTNKNCEAAIHLYRELGFKDSEEIRLKYGPSYQRCNLGMIYQP